MSYEQSKDGFQLGMTLHTNRGGIRKCARVLYDAALDEYIVEYYVNGKVVVDPETGGVFITQSRSQLRAVDSAKLFIQHVQEADVPVYQHAD